MSYDFKSIEEKWRAYWKKNTYFKTNNSHSNKKYYCLDMFPYPSGAGLHVGHWKGYVFSDVYARMKWLQGYNVLHPMGWDAFGLPAENYAIKQGIHPAISTNQNIENFKKQLDKIGAMYDWDREVNTTDPNYYKWTQWIFLQMFKMGLAYEENMPINWCPKCLTGLANEEVIAGSCERCGSQTFQKPIRQWVLRITKYAEKLISGLDKLDWPEKVKLMQINWIGKSVGARITFKTDNNIDLIVFTTRPDTLFGAKFLVMAPDHELVEKIVDEKYIKEVRAYQNEVAKLSELERTAETKEKTGVFVGCYAINPINQERLPIYLSSYVLKHYGTGIIMAVPAHDQRDFEFARKFNLPIKEVIKPKLQDNSCYDEKENLIKAFESEGVLVNSGQFDGLDNTQATKQIINFLSKKNQAEEFVTYKLRDWIFSRQRYWGEPIPLIHCKKCGIVSVPEDELPVLLPQVEKYQPTGTGESPLAGIDEWVNTKCPQCNGAAKRETNTMPQWAGSCWYFLRYTSPKDNEHAFNPKDVKYWMPVDLYVGGIEHAVLHLLYSRFYVKVLHDAGYLDFDEPFTKLFNQGMVCMKSSITGRVEKMSKSKGNVVTPDEIIEEMGTDTLRMYELFMGPPELDCEWQTDSIKGVRSFLNRLWAYLTNNENILSAGRLADEKSQRAFHRFLKRYQERLNDFKVNTAVAAIMEYLNELTENRYKFDHQMLEQFLVSLSVMVPHFSSELMENLLGKQLENCKWTDYDSALAMENEVEIAIQVNGKLRGTILLSKGLAQCDVAPKAKDIVEKWLEGKQIIKIVYVQDRLISFVIK